MLIFSVFLMFFVCKILCFIPNCVQENQFLFYSFPVEACSEQSEIKCWILTKGYFISLGAISLVKIKKTPVIPTCAFFGSNDLQFIYGVQSRIKVLATGAFMNLPKLEAIYLGYNQISEVRKDVFRNVSAELLDLSWNKISYIDSQAFTGLANLQHLNLSKNILRRLSPLYSLSTNLITLNLSYNLLNRIVLNTNKIPHLTHVDFSNNEIKKIAFDVEYPMEIIDLTNNHLKNFDYLSIRAVNTFKMGSNLFATVPKYIVNLNAKNIEISPNPWKCKELHSLWNTLNSFKIRLIPNNQLNYPECMNKPATLLQSPSHVLCSNDSECHSSLVCRGHKCLDPCKASFCHSSNICKTQNHEFTCSCPDELLTDPMDIHNRCLKVECFTSSHCSPPNNGCRDNKCVSLQYTIWTPIEVTYTISPWWFEEIPRKIPPGSLAKTPAGPRFNEEFF